MNLNFTFLLSTKENLFEIHLCIEMSNTLEVWRCFVSEPMGEKPVSELAGIGESLGSKLASLGFEKVNLIGYKYLAG